MRHYDTPENFYIENAMALLGTETQEEFSAQVGIAAAFICRVRQGKYRFSLRLFFELLEITGKKPSELFLELAMPSDYFNRSRS